MIVLDASVVVDAVLELAPHADTVYHHLRDNVEDLHAPHLIDAEVGEVLRRFALRGEVRRTRLEQAIVSLSNLGIQRYAHRFFLPRAISLGHNMTVYDGLYVALAEALGAPLLTRDARLARSARRIIEVIHVG